MGTCCPFFYTGFPLQSPVQTLQLDNFSWQFLQLVAVCGKHLSPLVGENFPPWQAVGGGDGGAVVHEGEMQSQTLGFSWAKTTHHSLLSPLQPVLPWPLTTLLPPLGKQKNQTVASTCQLAEKRERDQWIVAGMGTKPARANELC